MELLQISQRAASPRGTVHVVATQVGFTTAAREDPAPPVCTDVAKMIAAPVLPRNATTRRGRLRRASWPMTSAPEFRKEW